MDDDTFRVPPSVRERHHRLCVPIVEDDVGLDAAWLDQVAEGETQNGNESWRQRRNVLVRIGHGDADLTAGRFVGQGVPLGQDYNGWDVRPATCVTGNFTYGHWLMFRSFDPIR